MTLALDNVREFQIPTSTDQGPLKANRGMLVNKPQERRFESDKMLAEAPPISYDDTPKDLLYRQTEGQAEEFTRENPVFRFDQNQIPQTVEPPRPMMDPQLQQILQAQNDMSGIMMANRGPKQPESGLARLIANLPETYNV